MLIITYLLLLLIVFLGLFVGLLIGYMAKEELKPGLKYFNWLRHIIFIAILILFFVKNPSLLFLLVVAVLIILFSLSKHRETLYYYALAVIFFLSWGYNGFTMITPLIFLYSLPLGSMYLYAHVKEKKIKVILGLFYKYAGFLINGMVLGILWLVI